MQLYIRAMEFWFLRERLIMSCQWPPRVTRKQGVTLTHETRILVLISANPRSTTLDKAATCSVSAWMEVNRRALSSTAGKFAGCPKCSTKRQKSAKDEVSSIIPVSNRCVEVCWCLISDDVLSKVREPMTLSAYPRLLSPDVPIMANFTSPRHLQCDTDGYE